MAAYSNDLRGKLILVWQRGQNTEQELADNFGVSRGWVQKVIRHWRHTKQTTAPTYRHGPLPKIDPDRLLAQVQADPDATLEELAKRLRSSAPTVCRALQRLGLARKKNTARQRTKHRSGGKTAQAVAKKVPSARSPATRVPG
jgi:transposase